MKSFLIVMLIVGTIAAGFGSAALGFVQSAEPLGRDVAAVLRQGTTAGNITIEDGEGMEMVIVCGAPTDAAVGTRAALLGTLIGGVPMAVVAFSLASSSRTRPASWPYQWRPLFVSALMFQLGSVGLAALLLPLVILTLVEGHGAAWLGVVSMIDIVAGLPALAPWRRLSRSTSTQVLHVV